MSQATTATYDHPLPDRHGKALAVAEETRDLPEPRVSRDGTGPRRSVRYGWIASGEIAESGIRREPFASGHAERIRVSSGALFIRRSRHR